MAQAKDALFRAAEDGNVPELRRLLESGADLYDTDRYGQTVLMRAAYNGRLETVRFLLERDTRGKLMEAISSVCSYTALYLAAWNGHADIVRFLLDHGARLDTRPAGSETPLFIAAVANHLEVVRLLLERGMNADTPDKNGRTALRETIHYKRYEMATFLAPHCKDLDRLDYNKNTPLLLACKQNAKFELIKVLVECGADPRPPEAGNTALDMAARYSKVELCEWLVERIVWTAEELHSALRRACERDDADDIARFLLKRGADPNFPNQKGLAAMHVASMNGSQEMVELLIQSGGDVNLEGVVDGIRPLFCATKSPNQDVAALLLAHGACRTLRDKKGRSALHYTGTDRDESMIGYLIDQGVDPNVVDNVGMTLLHVTALHFEWRAVSALVNNGADLYARDARDRTPLTVCTQWEETRSLEDPTDSLKTIYWLMELGAVYEDKAENFPEIFEHTLVDCDPDDYINRSAMPLGFNVLDAGVTMDEAHQSCQPKDDVCHRHGHSQH
ncbi:hypothetical protein Poli38472_001887 [Pythium oligandrum]|uniref:Ankyrin repeat protein n=1 Tax=Pythium oligandrum TaxID=41045 RepID=A0A8K1CW67_PYTOL|nr:hypothetical protein Poli38472_001887 [Pythium oligandrum]|eukprot:TMW69731.1 hypothetical protein Poli38472_001887 [Pythium oligandrum]